MEQNTSIKYQALNDNSYRSLVAYVVALPYIVSLHPGMRTITISKYAADEVGKYIDDNGLDFHILPIEVDDENIDEVIESETTDANTLREIIHALKADKESQLTIINDITKQRDEAESKRDAYYGWWKESASQNSRVKEQVRAIAVMINSIYPKK